MPPAGCFLRGILPPLHASPAIHGPGLLFFHIASLALRASQHSA
jgi:hypothetical protein